MATEVLMQFLKNGLIDLNGSDEKLDKLIKTTDSLKEIINESPNKVLSYTLIALDPLAPKNDPVVNEVISVLESNWTTYFNTFADTPVQVVRAILLQALCDISEENHYIAIAIVSIARNILSKMEVGNERDMWLGLVRRMERKLNTVAEDEWATPEKIKVKQFVYDYGHSIEVNAADVAIDRVSLEAGIQKASGPLTPQN